MPIPKLMKAGGGERGQYILHTTLWIRWMIPYFSQ